MQKRCVFIINQDWYFISHWLARAKAILEAGFEVWVAVPQGEKFEEITGHGFKILPIPLKRKSLNPLTEIWALFALWRQIKAIKPQLIVNSTIKPNLYGSLIAGHLNISSLSSINGLGSIFFDSSLKRKLLKWFVKRSLSNASRASKNFYVFQHHHDRDLLTRDGTIKIEKTILIPGSGVDPNGFPYTEEPKEGPVRILFASRLLWDKGIKELVEASRMLKEKGYTFDLLFAGIIDPGNPSHVPESQIIEWEKQGILQWLGNVNNMAALMSSVNVVTLPSYGEGIPRVLIEAASCGRAIVTTDVPGCNVIVQHEENGLLVPLKNPAALADAFENLIKNPDKRREMGLHGRERVKSEFSESIVIQKTLETCRNIIEKNSL